MPAAIGSDPALRLQSRCLFLMLDKETLGPNPDQCLSQHSLHRYLDVRREFFPHSKNPFLLLVFHREGRDQRSVLLHRAMQLVDCLPLQFSEREVRSRNYGRSSKRNRPEPEKSGDNLPDIGSGDREDRHHSQVSKHQNYLDGHDPLEHSIHRSPEQERKKGSKKDDVAEDSHQLALRHHDAKKTGGCVTRQVSQDGRR